MKLKFMPFHFMHNYYYNVTICKMMESKKLIEMNIKIIQQCVVTVWSNFAKSCYFQKINITVLLVSHYFWNSTVLDDMVWLKSP